MPFLPLRTTAFLTLIVIATLQRYTTNATEDSASSTGNSIAGSNGIYASSSNHTSIAFSPVVRKESSIYPNVPNHLRVVTLSRDVFSRFPVPKINNYNSNKASLCANSCKNERRRRRTPHQQHRSVRSKPRTSRSRRRRKLRNSRRRQARRRASRQLSHRVFHPHHQRLTPRQRRVYFRNSRPENFRLRHRLPHQFKPEPIALPYFRPEDINRRGYQYQISQFHPPRHKSPSSEIRNPLYSHLADNQVYLHKLNARDSTESVGLRPPPPAEPVEHSSFSHISQSDTPGRWQQFIQNLIPLNFQGNYPLKNPFLAQDIPVIPDQHNFISVQPSPHHQTQFHQSSPQPQFGRHFSQNLSTQEHSSTNPTSPNSGRPQQSSHNTGPSALHSKQVDNITASHVARQSTAVNNTNVHIREAEEKEDSSNTGSSDDLRVGRAINVFSRYGFLTLSVKVSELM